jgi:D-arabinose 1-dehydrogenase-like Zn-dependent alcohol dehydrogenase
MELLGDVGQVVARFGPLEIVLIWAQGRCTICAECSMGMETISGTLDGTPR